MKEFDDLRAVLDRLLGPGGCAWDQEQTLMSMRGGMIEEAYEVIDAIDLGDNNKILEELGDLFFNVAFLCRLAEKEGRFTTAQALQCIVDKLIRRHPHVFGDVKLDDKEGIIKQWEKLKKEEKKDNKSALHDLPKGMPSLMRAQKIFKRIRHSNFPHLTPFERTFKDEEDLGEALLSLVHAAQASGLDAEQALRTVLAKQEAAIIAWEAAAHTT